MKCLWNYNALVDPTLADQPLIITEGECDAMAAIQCGYVRTVSVPDGAPAKEIAEDAESRKYGYLEHAKAALRDCREIILAVDGDEKGKILLHDLSIRLGKAKCKWVTYPKGCKDLNREYYVAFHGSNTFADFQAALDAAGIDKDGRARENGGMEKNPLFQGGDELYRGVIHVEVPEIDAYVTSVGSALTAGGANSIRVNPVFLCGQSALVFGVGQMPKPTFRESTDYQFVEGAGIEMCYVIAKAFKKWPKTASTLKQIGMVTGFFAASGT